MKIYFIDRSTGRKEEEKVYFGWAIDLLYGDHFLSKLFSFSLLPLIAKIPFFSWLFGFFQKTRFSKRKVLPFIKKYGIDSSEFIKSPGEFCSFNDFFIRKLKKQSRPIMEGEKKAVLFTDARYLFYPSIKKLDGFFVKKKKFSLKRFLDDENLSKRYENGSMVIARLCPTDYHRFHFPFDCIPKEPRLINGHLFSVNPLALKKNVEIFWENKRVITELETKHFGSSLYIEIGATYVGSIHQTFEPNKQQHKGDEKGYFSFGGSCIILLFEPERIHFDNDLLNYSNQKIEVRGLLGQSLGQSV